VTPADTTATLRLVEELFPDNNWPLATVQGVMARLGSLRMSAEEAKAALVKAHLRNGATRVSAAEVLQILCVTAATKAASAEPKRVLDARRLTKLPAAGIEELADAYYAAQIGRGIAPKHAKQDLYALLSDAWTPARPGPPSPMAMAEIEGKIGRVVARIVAKYTPQECGR
jgi:hypothetical protein